LSQDPTTALGAVTKQYADSHLMVLVEEVSADVEALKADLKLLRHEAGFA
jgi:hypothetical protein